jgi:hypothetical protein
MTIEEQFGRALAILERDYAVADVIHPATKMVFVLESPHAQELKHSTPAAGASGATMSKHLLGEAFRRQPLGILLKEKPRVYPNPLTLESLGILNVSPIPLQSSAYPDAGVQKTFGKWFEILNYIRTNNGRKWYQDERLNQIQSVLIQSFRLRLQSLQDRSIILVPCGKFAQKFVGLADVHGDRWQVINDVPHPSYNSWDRQRYQPIIQRLQEAFAYAQSNVHQ